MKEIFKDIPNYEGLYAVSNFGNVYSYTKCKNLKPSSNGKKYLQVDLCKKQKHKYPYVHRLVAEVFIPNPENKKQVNHKDENVQNNRMDNLEWCDKKYNLYYGTRIERISRKNRERCKIAIEQIDSEDNVVNTFESIADVERTLGFNHSNIVACLKGRIKSCYGYKWKYMGG